VDKSEFFKWIKCFGYWLFSAQFFASFPGLAFSHAARTTACRVLNFQQLVHQISLAEPREPAAENRVLGITSRDLVCG
jgi:hypothetical protein